MTVPRRERKTLRERYSRIGYLTARIYQEIYDDNILGLGAQLAFFFLFSLFPFLLLLTALLPYFTPPDAFDKLMTAIAPFVPPQIMELVYGNLREMLHEKRGGLLPATALLLIWSASNALFAIIEGLNVAYEVKESRGFWKSRLMGIGLTLGFSLLVLVSVLLLVFGGRLASWLAMHVALPVGFWRATRLLIAMAFMVLALDIIYYAAPNVRHPWRWLSPGALLAMPIWVVMSLGFSFYVSRFGRYEATYGALAAIILLNLWFYLSAVVLLIGGELNSILEREVLHEAVPQDATPPTEEKDHRVA